MAPVAIPQPLWFFLPAYVANPMAVVFGGGAPIDLGRTFRDGERLFGDGKTWRGLVGGTLAGALLGLLLTLPFLAFAPTSSWSFGDTGTAFSASAVLAFRALLRGLGRAPGVRCPRVRDVYVDVGPDVFVLRRHQAGGHESGTPPDDRGRHGTVRTPCRPDRGSRARRRADRRRRQSREPEAVPHGAESREGARDEGRLRGGAEPRGPRSVRRRRRHDRRHPARRHRPVAGARRADRGRRGGGRPGGGRRENALRNRRPPPRAAARDGPARVEVSRRMPPGTFAHLSRQTIDTTAFACPTERWTRSPSPARIGRARRRR